MGSTQRVILALSALLLGCSSSSSDEPAVEHSSAASPARLKPSGPPIALPTVQPQPATTIRLLKPGGEPRRLLRYRPAVGATDKLRIRSSYAMTISAGEHKMFSQTQSSTMDVTLTVAKHGANGDVHLDLSIRELKARTEGVSFEPHRGLQTFEGTAVISELGVVKQLDIPALEGNDDKRDLLSLSEYFYTLPAEPVGVGASWTAERVIVRSGMSMRTIDTATITAINGNTIETRQQTRQQTGPQLLTNARLPPPLMMETGDIRARGGGTATLRLDRPALADGSMSLRAGAGMRRRQPTQIFDMRFSMSADIGMERK